MTAADKPKKKSSQPIVFGLGQNQCIWAQAGVIKPMQCLNAFDCLSCPMDKKIQENRDQGSLTLLSHNPYGWSPDVKTWGRLPHEEQKCRHMLSGRVSYKLCSRGFECATCPFDDQIMDATLDQTPNAPATYNVAGITLAPDHYFHRGHAWARVEYGGRVRVGLDDFALRLVGKVDKIVLPGLGDTVTQTDPGLSLFRDNNTAQVLSPVDGVVIARNHRVLGRPQSAKNSPYGDGWLMVVQPTKLRTNLKNLLFGEESDNWIKDETEKLVDMVAQETGYQLAATGGEFVDDIYGQAPQVGWERLVREFLLTFGGVSQGR